MLRKTLSLKRPLIDPCRPTTDALELMALTTEASFFKQKKKPPEAESKQPELKLDPNQISRMLTHVVEGEQDEAEVLLRKDPYLALAYGIVTDSGNRTFKRISAFQYAVWALDWHMWEMMLRQFKEEHYAEAAKQYQELDEEGTEHGKQFSLNPMLKALQTYDSNFYIWSEAQRKEYWRKMVGGEEAKLVAHVADEYYRPNKSFDKAKNMFLETEHTRGKRREWWRHSDEQMLSDGNWKVGESWQKLSSVPMYLSYISLFHCPTPPWNIDRKILLQLGKIRAQQRDKLGDRLRELVVPHPAVP